VASRSVAPRPRTGCDLQRVDVVRDAIRDFGARYLDRVYTPAEQASYAAGGPASLAARFAAKEAVLKLIGTADGVDLRSVEITTPQGRPEVRLTGRAAELADEAGLADIDVSLSHDGDLALAVAVGLQHPPTRTTPTTSATTSANPSANPSESGAA
jgi:holo-[acyl-carrier protein] synthase